MPTLRSRNVSVRRGNFRVLFRPSHSAAVWLPANPGFYPRGSARLPRRQHLEATQNMELFCESPMPADYFRRKNCQMDVLTDPEPGMDSGQATVRNVRSKCRCSCVLQFTFRRAVSCVLHRPPSQVIHCTVLLSSCFFSLFTGKEQRKVTNMHIPSQGKSSG